MLFMVGVKLSYIVMSLQLTDTLLQEWSHDCVFRQS
jgi:hypothetical protein